MKTEVIMERCISECRHSFLDFRTWYCRERCMPIDERWSGFCGNFEPRETKSLSCRVSCAKYKMAYPSDCRTYRCEVLGRDIPIEDQVVMFDQCKYKELKMEEELTTIERVELCCRGLMRLLTAKNIKYGDSASKSVHIFNRAPAGGSICTRLDDKLSRIANRKDEILFNDVADLMGYLVLLCCNSDDWFKEEKWESLID